MKVLIYASNVKNLEKSGVGKACIHQQKCLDLVHIPYTTNPKDDYDIAHINTVFPDALLLARKAKAKGKKVKTFEILLDSLMVQHQHLNNG